MASKYTVVTNNQPRDVIEVWELTDKERTEFDYLDWAAIERGEDSATFIRYRGGTYDLGEFMLCRGMPLSSPLIAWDGYLSDSFFSGILVRYVENAERVIVARFMC